MEFILGQMENLTKDGGHLENKMVMVFSHRPMAHKRLDYGMMVRNRIGYKKKK